MGVRILEDKQAGKACFYDSVTNTAFGLVFMNADIGVLPASDIAELFLQWYLKKYGDPRGDKSSVIESRYLEFKRIKIEDKKCMCYYV